MSHCGLCTGGVVNNRMMLGRTARVGLLAVAMTLMVIPGMPSQGIAFLGMGALGLAAQEPGARRLEIDDPPAPVGDNLINQAGQDGATLRAVRVTEAFEIDGLLDEPFYRNVQAISEFVQGLPVEDGEPSELTEARSCPPGSGTPQDRTVGPRTRCGATPRSCGRTITSPSSSTRSMTVATRRLSVERPSEVSPTSR